MPLICLFHLALGINNQCIKDLTVFENGGRSGDFRCKKEYYFRNQLKIPECYLQNMTEAV